MRLPIAAICLTMTGLVGGCVHQPPPQAPLPPNPFGYLKRSAVCVPGPVSHVGDGRSVELKTRSDDGLCSIAISQPEGDAYASFLLTTLPVHGNSFIYNYNKQTVVTYTANTAYAGPDSFVVTLVPGGGKPRTTLQVSAVIDATGVVVPPPPAAAKPSVKPPVRRKARHHVTKPS